MIGLLICYSFPNYGSMLQAYATQYEVEKLGYSYEVIDYEYLLSEINHNKITRYFFPYDKKSLWNKCCGKLKDKFWFHIDGQYKNLIVEKQKKMSVFSNEKFQISEKYNSLSELEKKCQKYTTLLVGSDQLWLPSNLYSEFWNMGFLKRKINTISYATSFGVSHIPAVHGRQIKNSLSKIKHLSVREVSGAQIVKKFSDRNANVVCDPTLLLSREEWNKAIECKKMVEEAYVLTYFLGKNKWQREIVYRFAENMHFRLITLIHNDRYLDCDVPFQGYVPMGVGPEEFVNLIRYADYVFTDSFHGTVFSIINSRSFFTFCRFGENDKNSTNSRIFSLLDMCGLQNRIIESKEQELNYADNIDYEVVHKKLEKWRNDSVNFLKNALRE